MPLSLAHCVPLISSGGPLTLGNRYITLDFVSCFATRCQELATDIAECKKSSLLASQMLATMAKAM